MLPKEPLLIPQPDRSTVPIPMKEITHSKKKLGMWSSPSGDFGVHIEEARKKGEIWASRMKASRCPPCDVWLGLRDQLYRQMSYGNMALVHSPEVVEEMYQSVWYKVLPALKVNRNIRKAYVAITVSGLGASQSQH